MSVTALECQKLDLVFQSRPDIIESIKKAADSPKRVALFNEIANHVYDQLHGNGEPASKRRKVDAPQPTLKVNGAHQAPVVFGDAGGEEVLLHVKEISVSVPQRKKFELCFTQSFIYARAPGTTAPIPQISYAWQDIGTNLVSKSNPSLVEPLVFTVPATAPKEGILGGSEVAAAAAVSDTFKSLFHWAFQRRLRAAGNPIDVVSTDPSKFHSAVRQPQRPNEKAVHVSGFRGSKDGYLFFLENGILWGFKKPLILIPLNRIAAISYTNILQITFNMVVEVFSAIDGEPNEEFEFGMLDQQDYGGIDDFIKRNGLQDRSMAEQRKAKLQLAENRASKKSSGGDAQPDDDAGAADGDEKTELEKAHLEAEQQIQDDEDEDEEDYDPGSDDDSDGSGESSEDDEGDEQDGDEDEDEDEDQEGQGEEIDEAHHEQENKQVEAEAPPEPSQPYTTAKPSKSTKAKPIQQEQTKPQVPVRKGWASLRNPQPSGDVDMDMDENFEVA
ncbi:hypothetical protein E4U21_005987 [Claviceps maximensis]|nr:hypothetical protein E4U21_005987 [Claviceps maximensis]